MNNKLKVSLRVTIFVIALLLLLVNTSVVFGADLGGTAAPADIDFPLTQAYAQHYGVSIDEAQHRLKLEHSFPGLQSTLTKNESKTFGGLWIQHTPQFKIIVAFTQDGSTTVNKYNQYIPAEVAPYIEVRAVKTSLSDLIKQQDDVRFSLKNLGIPSASRVDIMNNCITFDIANSRRNDFETAAQGAKLALPDTFKVSYVESIGRNDTDIYGGLPQFTGTSGFSVRNSTNGNKYLVTAGHFGANNNNWNGYPLTYISNPPYQYGGDYDCELLGVPNGLNITNKIQWYQGGYTRDITSVQGRDEQIVGTDISKYGKTTNYTYGQIYSIWAVAGNVLQGAGYSTNDWVEVHNVYSLEPLVDNGDSGCPWFIGNTAYGIHSGSTTDTNHNTAWFMSIDFLYPGLGVTVMTSPYPTIAASSGSGGYISPVGNVVVTQGTDQTFNFYPNTGYHVADVIVDGSSVGNPAYLLSPMFRVTIVYQLALQLIHTL